MEKEIGGRQRAFGAAGFFNSNGRRSIHGL
jgi:hypothetical protein